LKKQKVTVKGNVQPEAVLQTVSKTGKKTSFCEAEAPAASEEKPAEAVDNVCSEQLL
jgi:copper chaperone